MRNVYYIGFYSGEKCIKRKNTAENLAATVKMNFLIDSLKSLGYHVTLVSISIGTGTGFFPAEHVMVDDLEEHYYVPYFSVEIGGKTCGGGKTAWNYLKIFALQHIKKDDIVITYHSLVYREFWKKLHKRVGFMWIPDVAEIYCFSRKDYQDQKYLTREVEMFSSGDAMLFSNDALAKKYANGKPFVVDYGNYNVYAERDAFDGEKIGIVYTGIINEERGVFKTIDAMKYLSEKFELHILGFGTDADMARMREQINEVNKAGKRIFFEGTKTGKEYTEFLLKHQIGVSLMDVSKEISENAFPSKILPYLGHSLFVVSSKCSCVVNSKLADVLYFCDDSAEDVARVISEVPVYTKNNSAVKLNELREQFINDLSGILSNNK